MFKYLRLNSRMNLLWRTLDIAVYDLIAFFIIFLMVFCGYAIMGFLIFGPQIRSFHSLSTSFWACFNMLLGQFTYDELLLAAPRVAPLFFGSFMLLVYITFINMFIAIVNECVALCVACDMMPWRWFVCVWQLTVPPATIPTCARFCGVQVLCGSAKREEG